ncbi:epididymal-specific lipocalin-8 isoform X1 [Nycticebus coucang]|uniref:epididymal-specific lipocalin-8 isoform X1 n=1 Tax=Nycticebus coucang TaxID=9470 RepID=UPI00234DCA1C|nr:epididymal-specific lipocalin-8 isoform X1 [Nycticebus coucang]
MSTLLPFSSGSCETEKIVGSEINVSGKFAFPGQREIQVLDTDYEGYAILRLSLLWQGREFHVLKYFTRSLEDDDHLGFWRFREVTADTGLYLAPRHGRCAELLKQSRGWDCHPISQTERLRLGELSALPKARQLDTGPVKWPSPLPHGTSGGRADPEPCPVCHRS